MALKSVKILEGLASENYIVVGGKSEMEAKS